MAELYRTKNAPKINTRATAGHFVLQWELKPRDFGTELIIAPEANEGWDHALVNREVRFGPVVATSPGSPVKVGERVAVRKLSGTQEFWWEGDRYSKIPNDHIHIAVLEDGFVPG